MGKLRFREVEQPAQGYATMKGWDWDLDPETDIQLSSSGGSAGGGGEGGGDGAKPGERMHEMHEKGVSVGECLVCP